MFLTIKKSPFCKCLVLPLITSVFVGCKTLGELEEMKNQILSSSGPVTIEEMHAAFRDALEQGVKTGVSKLAQKGAFLNDPELRIPFPPEAQKIQAKLKKIGLESVSERFEVSVNTAAESAMTMAFPIFENAIKNLNFKDAVKLLKGPDSAVTEYLRKATETELIKQFKPVVDTQLKAVSATKYWSQIVTTYNRFSSGPDFSNDLGLFVCEQAIDGLFKQIAQEEKEIRKNPAARTTEVMKRVFE